MEDLKKLLAAATPGPWTHASDKLAAGNIKAPDNAALICAAVNALPELLAKVEWQPIETAPKGRKSVLLGCDYDRHGKQRVTLAWWDDQFEPSGVSGCWIEGWFYDPQEDQNEPMRVEFRPSHWMPLPTPPAAQTLKERKDV